MAGGAEHQFIAWTRTGLGALLDGGGKVVELDLGSSGSVSRTITQYGPGHVLGLDPRSVVRTVPSNGAPDFEPNLFPSIEFSHPALPWLLSPSSDPPTPWIALVVVEVTAGVTLAAVGGKLVLTIDAPARPHDQLPDLSQAWAWAHGQITGAEGDPIDTAALLRSTGIGRSRLIAPRHLEASKSYYACVVPTFAEGVAAALATPSATGLAWTGSETTVRLPVYTSWQFSTASEGDFASLVKRVQPESLDVSVGHRGVDISEPGWGGASSPGAVLEVAGALYSPAWTQPTLDAASATLGASIAVEIDAAASPTPNVPPTFSPPFYGSAATHTEAVAAAPSWQRALNTDIRQRIAAGIGSQVVRANLDRFVEAAWTAIGDSEGINHLIRHAELAGAITQRIADKHLSTVTASGELFAIARPLLARVRSSTSATLAAVVIASSMPTAALSASFRRLGRPAGTLARATTKSGVLLERINSRTIVPVPDKVLASGAASFDQVSIATNSVARLASATADALTRAATGWKLATTISSPSLEPQLPAIARAPVTPAVDTTTRAVARGVLPVGERGTIRLPSDVKPTNVQVDAFAAAARRHQLYIMQRLSRISDRPAPFPQLDTVRSQLALQWTPERGIIPVVSSRISGIDVQTTSTFTPVTVKPVLAQPLIQSLQALSPQLVMPGVSNVLPNRMAIAAVNPEFVRGLLVGANEELARELLWRRYPAALGHTWLQTFWGCVRPGPDGQPVDVPDIPPIETWLDTAPVAGPGQLALLIRGDVLHRYPNALVYAVSAAWQGNYRVIGDGAPLLPTIATTLGGDIALFGFDLDVAVAKGGTAQPASAGWYFVIGEHPHEPRFGLAATSTQPLTRWGDVAWSDLAATDLGGNYLRIDGPLAARTFQTSPLRWGADAAQIASITFRRVSRVAIHASRLL